MTNTNTKVYDFAEQIASIVANSGSRTKCSQLGCRIIGSVIVVLVIKINQYCPRKTAEHLRHYVRNNQTPAECSGSSQTQRNSRVEMGARIGPRDEDTEHDGKSPGYCHDNPTAVLAFRLLQKIRGNHPIAKQYQYGRPDKLEETFGKYNIIHGFQLLRLMNFIVSYSHTMYV